MPKPHSPGPDPPSEPAPRTGRWDAQRLYGLLFVALFGGLAAAIYAVSEYLNPALAQVCSTNSWVSCSKVAASGHTSVLGVPDWAIGLIGYLLMVAVAIVAYRTFDRTYLKLLAGLSTIGLGFSIYFAYEEAVVIHALCPVCTTAHLLNVAVLALTLSLLRLSRPETVAPREAEPPASAAPSSP